VPNYYDLGTVEVGSSSSTMAGYLKNSGDVPVNLTSAVNIHGTYASLFSSPELPGGLPDCASGLNLQAGATCEFGLRFTPQAVGTANTPISANFVGGSTSKAVQGVGSTPLPTCSNSGPHSFSYTGAYAYLSVPAGCTVATIKAWGAAGGSNGGLGGAGGYATASFTVTESEQLTVAIGHPGEIRASGVTANENYTAGAFLPGGRGGKASGGGLVAVSKAANLLLVAGSGGGGFGSGVGGGGGGTNGQNAVNGVAGGYADSVGGSQSGGGGLTTPTAGGCTSRAQYVSGGYLTGGLGNGDYPGYLGIGIADDAAGGGSGYFGGGGGTYCGTTGGGGGSGYYSTANGYLSGGSLSAATGSTPGNAGDSDRAGAGSPAMGQPGGSGKVIIRFN